MTPERIELGSGVALNLLPCDTFKTNCLSVTFLCPMREDSAAENALLPFVLKRGTERLPTMTALTRELEMLYGSHVSARVGKVGDTQFFGFHSSPLREEFAEGTDVTAKILALMGEMIYHPYREDGLLSSSYTEGEKQVMIDAVRSRINNKGHYALLRCREEMCRTDASALPETGTEEQIAAISAETLTARLDRVRTTYRLEIWCVGVFDREALTEQVRSIFLCHKRQPMPLPPHRPFVPAEPSRRVTEKLPVKQGKLCLGFGTPIRTGHPMAPAYTLLLEVLSGSPTAKLFVNVREKESLCYYCSGIPEMQKGILILSSGIEVADRERAEAAILREVAACCRGEISHEEMTAAKKAIETSVRAMYDEPSALISWYFKRGLIGLTESPLDYWDRIATVTVDDLAKAAKTLSLDTVYFLEGTLSGEEDDDTDA
ncbi:MAG: insulinase family protein [Ruminococcaceae bacterium]|nr:insulinase family protein [Oscillospiraceae bacterium]